MNIFIYTNKHTHLANTHNLFLSKLYAWQMKVKTGLSGVSFAAKAAELIREKSTMSGQTLHCNTERVAGWMVSFGTNTKKKKKTRGKPHARLLSQSEHPTTDKNYSPTLAPYSISQVWFFFKSARIESNKPFLLQPTSQAVLRKC